MSIDKLSRQIEADAMRRAIELFRLTASAVEGRVSTSERRIITPKGQTLYSVRRG